MRGKAGEPRASASRGKGARVRKVVEPHARSRKPLGRARCVRSERALGCAARDEMGSAME